MRASDPGAIEPAGTQGMSEGEFGKRQKRWRFFQVIFAVVYVGIILDVITTALGFVKTGSKYEQNPLGISLISDVGWPGLVVVLTVLCLICYHSVRVVYARMSTRWSVLINTIMVLVAAFRWLAVVTAIIYLLQPATPQ
ncbi:MAG: hypothetical protein ACRDFX_08115 [Chloroflexota bacterium]